jgi:hypothetical protein
MRYSPAAGSFTHNRHSEVEEILDCNLGHGVLKVQINGIGRIGIVVAVTQDHVGWDYTFTYRGEGKAQGRMYWDYIFWTDSSSNAPSLREQIENIVYFVNTQGVETRTYEVTETYFDPSEFEEDSFTIWDYPS